MPNVTDGILSKAIAALQSEFDSHDVIRQIMRIAPLAYADDLGSTRGQDPILEYHASIGRRLLQRTDIEPTNRVRSSNVREEEVENQGWRKR